MIKERIIWLFTITTGLVVLCANYLPRPKDDELIGKQFWIKKTFANENYDIVLIGDSRTYRGIDPTIISLKNGNRRCLNFGYSSAGLSHLFLQNGVKKLSLNGSKIVVLCFTPYSLTPNACKNEHFLQETKRKKEEILGAKYFSGLLYYFRPVDPRFILDGTYLHEDSLTYDSLYYHQEYQSDGFLASWKLKHEYAKTVSDYKREFKNNVPDQQTITDVLQYVKKLKSLGYKVFGLRMPVIPELYQLEESIAGDIFKNLIKQFSINGGVWINMPLVTNGSYDGSHMDKWEAKRFSEKLGECLHKELQQE